jgi:SH3 domain-containing YSC84-like protein 1
MRWMTLGFCAALLVSVAAPSWSEKAAQEKRLQESAEVVREILALPEGIPEDILNKAECVCVFPSVKKVALGVGGSYGKGALVCRTGPEFKGPWGEPAMMRLEGGSFGFQIGGTVIDFVLLVMNPKGTGSLLSSKVKLGADATVAAGPVGRTAAAATDAFMDAEILSYSRSKGLFAGISLEGSTVREDSGDNEDLYGRKIGAKEIVLEGKATLPEAAKPLIAALEKASPGESKGESKSPQ